MSNLAETTATANREANLVPALSAEDAAVYLNSPYITHALLDAIYPYGQKLDIDDRRQMVAALVRAGQVTIAADRHPLTGRHITEVGEEMDELREKVEALKSKGARNKYRATLANVHEEYRLIPSRMVKGIREENLWAADDLLRRLNAMVKNGQEASEKLAKRVVDLPLLSSFGASSGLLRDIAKGEYALRVIRLVEEIGITAAAKRVVDEMTEELAMQRPAVRTGDEESRRAAQEFVNELRASRVLR